MGVFTMPSLGADMESGRIVEWLVQPGDTVHRGDVVAVVDTTKAAIEVEVFEDGTVTELLVQPGTEVDVGTPLAMIDTEVDDQIIAGDSDADSPQTDDRSPRRAHQAKQAEKPRQTVRPEQSESTEPVVPVENLKARLISLKAMPPVRHLARQLGVNLDSITGSGPHGKITRMDVESAATAGLHTGSGTKGDTLQESEPEPEQEHAEPVQRGATPTLTPESSTLTPESSTLTPESGPGPGSEQEPEAAPPQSVATSGGRLRATPRARRLAAHRGIELASISGTGADGAITGPDVDKAAARSSSKRANVSVADKSAAESADKRGKATPRVATGKIAAGEERRAMRRSAIAALMARSAREIPHYYVSQTVELAHALDWLHSHNANLSVRDRVLPAALFLRATVQAAQEVNEVNGHWVDDTFIPANGVQLGVAVAMRDGGLLTPVIIDAHLLDLDELMAHLADLVRRARSGRLRSREIEPGSITVSSLADGGPDALFGVIYPPQVALVGIGGVADRPWAVDGTLASRPTVTLTIAADHRATDGRIGAKFLAALSRALTRPEDM